MSEEIELALIRILTESLIADDVAHKHRIPHNPKLFAHMVRHIVEIGVVNYCAASENDE